MDQILLNQKLADWDKACRYFATQSIQDQLSNEEKQAVTFLTTYWRDKEFNPAACETHITVLKQSDKLHSSNREIIEHSKLLRGIAQTFYTKDAATFNIFRSALGWKPKQNNQTPTPEGAPKHNEVMMMGWAEKWTKAMQYLKSAEIVPQLEQSELTAVEQLGDMWRRPKYSPDMKREAEEYIATLTASHKYHASNRDIIEQSKNLCHVARNIYANEETFTTFKKVLTKYNSEHKPPRREHIPTPTPTPTPKPNPTPTPNNRRDTVLKITNIIFGGSDRQGNIVVPFGGTIYNSVQYIKPKIVVGSEYYGTHEVEFSLHYSDGGHDSYTDTVTFNGKGEYITSGWGSESGTVYRDIDYVDYTIRINHRVVWECRVPIAKDKSIPTVPTISKVLFAATDYDGNIMMEPNDSLPTGIQYLSPYITISNNFTGTVDLVIRIRRGDGRTSEYDTTLKVNGAGNYYLIGWGNKEGTSYLDADTITVDIIHKGKVLNSSKVRITASARKYRRNQNQSTKESGWQRFNNWVEDVGDWLEDHSETVGIILGAIVFLIYAIYVIVVWVNEGFWMALLAGFIGFFIAGIAAYLLMIGGNVLSWILRFVFLNAWTFLLAVGILVGTVVLPAVGAIFEGSNDYEEYSYTEAEPVYETETYYVTAQSLNVRSYASKNASVVGSLSKYQSVEVIEYNASNGFAKIRYNGDIAYISNKYISK